MAVTDFFIGDLATELIRQLFTVSAKALKYKKTADRLNDLIENILPTIKEIQYSGVELPPHRQAQIGMVSCTLEKGIKLVERVFSARRWNMYRQFVLARKMERIEKTIYDYLKNQILTHILVEVHLHRASSDTRFDRVDRSLQRMAEHLGSMESGGGGSIIEATRMGEAAREFAANIDTETYGVALKCVIRFGLLWFSTFGLLTILYMYRY